MAKVTAAATLLLCKTSLCIFCISINLQPTCSQAGKEGGLLRNHIFQSFHIMKTSNITVQAEIEWLGLYNIKLDVPKEKMKLTGMLQVSWKDPGSFSEWDPAQYGGISQVIIPWTPKWRPHILIANSVSSTNTIFTTSFTMNYKITWDAQVSTRLWTQFEVRCPLNLAMFPFDRHSCPIKLTTDYIHSNGNLTIRFTNSQSQQKYHRHSRWYDAVSKEWQLLPLQVQDLDGVLQFQFTLKRRPTYYMVVTIVPLIVATLATVTLFLLPPMSKEKLFMGGTAIGIQFMLLFHLSWITPVTSQSVPILMALCCWSLTMSMTYLIFMVVIFILSIQQRLSLIPNLIKKILKGCCGSILCLPISKSQIKIYRAHFVSSADDVSFEQSPSAANEQELQEDYKEEWVILFTALDRLLFLFYCCSYVTLIVWHFL